MKTLKWLLTVLALCLSLNAQTLMISLEDVNYMEAIPNVGCANVEFVIDYTDSGVKVIDTELYQVAYSIDLDGFDDDVVVVCLLNDINSNGSPEIITWKSVYNFGGNWDSHVQVVDAEAGDVLLSVDHVTAGLAMDIYPGHSGNWTLLIKTSGSSHDLAWVYDLGISSISATNIQSSQIKIATARLLTNYPNPFNGSTKMEYQTPAPSKAVLTIYDNLGRTVKTSTVNHAVAGEYSYDWDGTDSNGLSVSSGIYHVRIELDGQVLSKSVILAK